MMHNPSVFLTIIPVSFEFVKIVFWRFYKEKILRDVCKQLNVLIIDCHLPFITN